MADTNLFSRLLRLFQTNVIIKKNVAPEEATMKGMS